MRIVVWLVLAGAVALVGYLLVMGTLLARLAAGILTVGPLVTALGEATPPTDPMALGYRGDPTVALSLPFEVVGIETPLGPTEAWLVPAAGPEVGRAVYVHGIAGAREDGYRHLSLLHEAGWAVLLITYRNDASAPRSTEEKYAFGLTEWPDLEAAVQYLSPGPDGPGLVIVAESMGGAVLGQFLARSPLADRVAGVALDSPALSFQAVIGQIADHSGKPLPGAITWVASRLAPWLTDLPLSEAEVAATYTSFPHPLFIAHGSGDRITPIAPSKTMAAARSAPTVSLWTRADHLGSFAEDTEAYAKAFAAFLAELKP